jgi:hypothetical protein
MAVVRRRVWGRAVLCAAALFCCVVPFSGQDAVTAKADAFVDSVGVNVHLHYTDTRYYTDWRMIKSRLLDLGVRHVRDGMTVTRLTDYYNRHIELGAAGITTLFIAGVDATSEELAAYPKLVPGAFEAYEGPNEHDLNGGPNWERALRAAVIRIWGMRSIPAVGRFPIYGPSLTTEAAYKRLGDISAYADASNLHNYFSGHHPGSGGWGDGGYGSLTWALSRSAEQAPRKPVITTETGYWTDAAVPGHVTETIAARYMPRLLLEHFRHGIQRTYIYELLDFPKTGVPALSGYGLLATDGRPKASFTAVKSLLGLLADPGPSFVATPLGYTVSGGGSDLRSMAFAKRDGSQWLALWIEQPGWNPATALPITVMPREVSVMLSGAHVVTRTHAWRSDGTIEANDVAMPSGSLGVTVTDVLQVLEIQPAVRSEREARSMWPPR